VFLNFLFFILVDGDFSVDKRSSNVYENHPDIPSVKTSLTSTVSSSVTTSTEVNETVCSD